MGTTVVRRCDRAETFLAGGIPNLKLDGLSVKFNGADFLNWLCGERVRLAMHKVPAMLMSKRRREPCKTRKGTAVTEPRCTTYKVYTNSRNVTLGVSIISESKEQAGLSNTRISNQ